MQIGPLSILSRAALSGIGMKMIWASQNDLLTVLCLDWDFWIKFEFLVPWMLSNTRRWSRVGPAFSLWKCLAGNSTFLMHMWLQALYLFSVFKLHLSIACMVFLLSLQCYKMLWYFLFAPNIGDVYLPSFPVYRSESLVCSVCWTFSITSFLFFLPNCAVTHLFSVWLNYGLISGFSSSAFFFIIY